MYMIVPFLHGKRFGTIVYTTVWCKRFLVTVQNLASIWIPTIFNDVSIFTHYLTKCVIKCRQCWRKTIILEVKKNQLKYCVEFQIFLGHVIQLPSDRSECMYISVDKYHAGPGRGSKVEIIFRWFDPTKKIPKISYMGFWVQGCTAA